MAAVEGGGGNHGSRIIALRIFDFGGDSRGVVPAHVVPHGDQDGRGEGWSRDRSRGKLLRELDH